MTLSRVNPLVSILTPSFNQARWLGDNLSSVSCQTYPRVEHIVMDGGSTDGSVDLLRAAGSDVRWRTEPDEGQAHAVNKAFLEAEGKIIGWINSDDAYADCTVIDAVVEEFARHPEADVIYGHCLQVSAEGAAIQVLWAPPFDVELQRAVNLQAQPATFLRRSSLTAPLLDESFDFAMDYELWLRLASQGLRFHRMNRILAMDRHQPERKSSTIKAVHQADLARLDAMYGLHLSSDWDRRRAAFYVKQRLLGARLIWDVRPDALAFAAPPGMRRGLLRRQLLTRRRSWPAEYR